MCHLFRRHLGPTPWAYLIKLRLTSAQSLLQGTNLPIRRIRELVGFRDLRYFRRPFRKALGCPKIIKPSGPPGPGPKKEGEERLEGEEKRGEQSEEKAGGPSSKNMPADQP